jgi:phosphoglycerate kinase
MLQNLKTVDPDIFIDKKILLRLDYNVPVKNGIVVDDTRIRATIPTLRFFQKQGSKIIIFSHLGKIKSESDQLKLSLLPIAKRLEELIMEPVLFVDKTHGKELEETIDDMESGQILILENTRFEDLNGLKESKNDQELSKY